MTRFTLDWHGTRYEHESLSASLLREAVDGFCPQRDDYIILIPERPIQFSGYMQAASPKGKNGSMPVEISFDDPNGDIRHYRYMTRRKDEIYKILEDYFTRGQLPDMTLFEDVTEELFPGNRGGARKSVNKNYSDLSGYAASKAVQALHGAARKAEKNMDSSSFVMRYPKGYAIIGLICFVGFLGFIALPIFVDEEFDGFWRFYIGLFSSFALMCLLLIWVSVRWKIVVKGSDLRVTPIFGRTKDINVAEIAYIREVNYGGVLGIKAFDSRGRRLFSADGNAGGFTLLFERLKPLLRKETTYIQQKPTVLKWPTAWMVICNIVNVFFLVIAYVYFTSPDKELLTSVLIPLYPLTMLYFTLITSILRVTLKDGIITVRHPFKRKVSIPATQVQYGGDIIGRHGAYGGFILLDDCGKRILKAYNHYSGFFEFERELKRLGVVLPGKDISRI